MKKIGINLGKFQVWQSRVSNYIGIINFLMIFYLYIITKPFGLPVAVWAVLVFFTIAFIIIIDSKIVYPNALRYTFVKNPEFMELKKMVKEMYEERK